VSPAATVACGDRINCADEWKDPCGEWNELCDEWNDGGAE
jgi:hypothetical protein